ncbi:MAG TPA: bacteriohemerythrin [Acidobacteriaceae bacterium]|nr:bacteriohemerythrin [Acidobacteriaceae bacterium]
MAEFAWDESCGVPVRAFDEQHRKLFEVIGSLAEATSASRSEEVIRHVVHSLAVYTSTHFHQEEVLMDRTGYPAPAAHNAQRARLTAEVGKYRNEPDEGGRPNTAALPSFLRKWLKEHIRKSDLEYSAHLNAHGVRWKWSHKHVLGSSEQLAPRLDGGSHSSQF